MSGDPYVIRTNRPQSGFLGMALSAQDPALALARGLAEQLDAGEGWVSSDGDSWFWYPHRHVVALTPIRTALGLGLLVDTTVIVETPATPELLDWLNALNAHASGWRWWLAGDGSVHCAMRIPVDERYWWWPQFVWNSLARYATTIDAMAIVLAQCSGGQLPYVAHPQRGDRPAPDGWLRTIRRGSREPSAALGAWISEAEISRCVDSLRTTGLAVELTTIPSLQIIVRDADGEPAVVLRDHWHAELGQGLMIVTLGGILPSDAVVSTQTCLAFIAQFNEHEMAESGASSTGGWWYSDTTGFVSTTFLPAFDVEECATNAGPTIGDVVSLMMETAPRISSASLLRMLLSEHLDVELSPARAEHIEALAFSWQTGPVGWSYFSDRSGRAAEDMDEVLWLAPRHVLAATWGFFNPMGPTVNSLELGFLDAGPGGIHTRVFWVMRHPQSPTIIELATLTGGQSVEKAIWQALVTDQDGPLGLGLEWLQVHAHADAIIQAVDAQTRRQPDSDWSGQADELLYFALAPWTRIGDRMGEVPAAFRPGTDPVDAWLTAVTDNQVIAGIRLFMRSAWEGAKAFRQSGFDADGPAQDLVDELVAVAYERLNAPPASTDLAASAHGPKLSPGAAVLAHPWQYNQL